MRSASRDQPAAKRALKRLPRRVLELRTKAGLTQERAAEAACVEPKYWISLEAGRANPTLATLAAVAAALGTSLSELLQDV
ncbi:MAG TPA: helix-turn-helix transcriptional regulator [Polyangiaceae bacterium]